MYIVIHWVVIEPGIRELQAVRLLGMTDATI